MLDAIKHITDFSFKKTAHRCIVCVTQSNWVKMWFSRFPLLPGSAEAQVIWGGIVKRLLIARFIGNISAKKYQNPFMCVKVIVSQRWDVFCDTVYIFGGWAAITLGIGPQSSVCIFYALSVFVGVFACVSCSIVLWTLFDTNKWLIDWLLYRTLVCGVSHFADCITKITSTK